MDRGCSSPTKGEESTVAEEHHQSANSDEIIRHLEIDEDYTPKVKTPESKSETGPVDGASTNAAGIEYDEDKDYDSYGDEDDDEEATATSAKNTTNNDTKKIDESSKTNDEAGNDASVKKEEGELDEDEAHDFEYDTALEFFQVTKVASTSTVTSTSSENLVKEKEEEPPSTENPTSSDSTNKVITTESSGVVDEQKSDETMTAVNDELEDDDDDDEFANSKKLKIDEGENSVDRIKSEPTTSSIVKSESKENTESKPKVPPLKIIISTSSAGDGLPYVKPSPTSSEEPFSGQQTPTKLAPKQTTRSAAAKAAAASTTGRVPSPVPNRTSANNKTRSVSNQPAGGRVSPTKQPTSHPITQSASTSSLQGNDPQATSNEKEQKRKLRSHTRGQQQQNQQDSNSKSSPSTSPLTVAASTQDSSNSNSNEGAIDHHHHEENSIDCDIDTSRQGGITTRKRRYNNTPVNTTKSNTDSSKSNETESAENAEAGSASSPPKESGENNNEQSTGDHGAVASKTESSESSSGHGSDENQADEQQPMVIDSENTAVESAILTESNEATGTSLASNLAENNPVESASATNQAPPLINCTRKYLDIRSEVVKRRNALMEKKPDHKPPNNLNDYLLFKKSYLIKMNRDAKQTIPFYKPPGDLPDELKEYFLTQEKERYQLRIRHRVEQDKLAILYEQEVLRCYTRLAQYELNQSAPFSFCTIIKDDEVYFEVKPPQQPATQTPIDTESPEFLDECKEKFISSINQVKSKFQKLKDDLIKRQLNESDSLYAVQKMDFQSKLRELKESSKSKTGASGGGGAGTGIGSSNLTYSDSHVPIVSVNNKLELIDISY